MALQKQKKSLLFDKGIDTKTNPKLTEGYLQLNNCFIDNVSLNKSPGYELLIPGQNPISGDVKALISDSRQLIPILNDDVYVYDAALQQNIFRAPFSFLDRLTTTTTQIIGNVTNTSGTYLPDTQNQFYSEYGDFEAIGYRDPQANVRLRINDKRTRITLQDVLLDSTGTLQILSMNCTQNAVFIYSTKQISAGGPIDELIVFYSPNVPQISNPAIIALITTVTTSTGAFYYPFPQLTTEFDGQFIWIFYVDNTTALQVLIRSLFSSSEAAITPGFTNSRVINVTSKIFNPASMSSQYISTEVQPPIPFVSISSAMFWVCGSQLLVFNANNRTFITAVNIAINAESYTQSLCANNITPSLTPDVLENMFFLNISPTEYCTPEALEGFPPIVNNVFLPTPVVSQYSTVPAYWTQGNTDKYVYGTSFCGGGLFSTPSNAYFLLATMPYLYNSGAGAVTPAANIHLNYYIVDVNYNMVDHVTHYIGTQKVIVNTSTQYNAVPFGPVVTKPNLVTQNQNYCTIEELQTEIQGGEVTYTTGLKTQQIFQNPEAKVYIAERGAASYFGATDLKKLTPSTVDEVNFLDFPVITAKPTVAGSATNPTFWSYTVTFEYTDSSGDLVRSYPARPFSANIAYVVSPAPPPYTPQTVNLFFTPPNWLETKSNIVIKIWRTTVNSSLYYLLTTKIFPKIATNSDIFNPTTFDPFYADNMSDKTISGNEIAYFNGGVLGELPFETFTSMALHNNRVFSVKASNQNIIQYSLPFQPQVSLATSFNLEFYIEPQGGVITELASLDDKLIIFKKSYIYAVSGDGVDATGANSTLTTPFRINSPVGCSEPLSVVRMPQGIMFKSTKGIYLLARDLSLSYIGAPVEKYNNLTISSATLFTTFNKVMFSTYQGTLLIYDYYYNTWSTESGINIFASTSFLTDLYIIDNNNNLSILFDGYYKNNMPYAMTIETPWIKTAGLQGFQRAWWLMVLGTWQGPSGIQIGISYDFVDIVQDWLSFTKDDTNSYGTNAWGSLTPFGGMETSNFEIRFFIPKQKCQAIKFTIQDTFGNIATETGNSFSLQELALIYGILAEAVSLPVNRSA